MAQKNFDNLWRDEFHDNVIAKDKTHDINLNKLNLKVNDALKKS